MKRINVLVCGDAMLDLMRTGAITRSSPEDRRCPVFVEESERREWTLGGAANVAHWLAADPRLGVSLLTPFGGDADGKRLVSLCLESGIRMVTALYDPARGTTVKERILIEEAAKNTVVHLLRIDRDCCEPPRMTDVASAAYEISHPMYSAVVAVDYNKGTFMGEAGIQLLGAIQQCRGLRIANTKLLDRWKHIEVDVLACNRQEAIAGGLDGTHGPEPHLSQVRAEYLIVTRGAHGVVGMTRGARGSDPSSVIRDTLAREVVDVCGAGDAFLAGLVRKWLAVGCSGLVTPNGLVDLLDAGQRSAAWCCSQVGVGMPLVLPEEE